MPAAKPVPGTLVEILDLGQILGSTWDGYKLIPGRHDSAVPLQGEFLHDMWGRRRPFTAGELRGLFWTQQLLAGVQHERDRLAAELAAGVDELQRAEDRAAWYRRQLMLESRAGAMLARILA